VQASRVSSEQDFATFMRFLTSLKSKLRKERNRKVNGCCHGIECQTASSFPREQLTVYFFLQAFVALDLFNETGRSIGFQQYIPFSLIEGSHRPNLVFAVLFWVDRHKKRLCTGVLFAIGAE
jgi:hypothetical protein